jgi:tetratricopeptide (TPR) repeat protein
MKNILKYYVAVVMFLFPIFFLPVVSGSFGFGKSWFLGMAGMLGLLVWLLDLWLNKSKVRGSRVLLFMVLVALWTMISWLRMGTGLRMKSMLGSFGFGTVMSMVVWVFLWVQVAGKEEFDRQLKFLSAAGLLVALSSIVAFLLPENKLPINWPVENPMVSIGQGWSLTGSLTADVFLMLFLVSEWGKRLWLKLKKKDEGVSFVMEAVATGVFGLVLALSIYRLISVGWVKLDGNSSWVIAVDTLKQSPWFGVGIGNFLEAFNLFRPVSYNVGPYWSSAFMVSGMMSLHVWTELGLGGLVLMFLMVRGWFMKKDEMKGKRKVDFWRMGIFLAIFLLNPINLMAVFLLAWWFSVKIYEVGEGASLATNFELKREGGATTDLAMIMRGAISLIVVALIGFGGFWSIKMLLGEVYLRNSFVAMAKNDAKATYDWQFKARVANPAAAEYRRYYSQTNLAIALNLLAGEEEVTEEQKQQAGLLVQQAVDDAKAAVTLDQANAVYWSNLATIYKQLVGLVDGTADWSLQAYQQAVAFDPVNPLLRLDLGSLLFAGARYEEADRVFEQVLINKQDFANGWYNWAYNAKMMNRLADAVARLAQAVALVPVDSGDYEKASGELTAWRAELDELVKAQEASASSGATVPEPETFTQPEPLPTVGEEERVEVPAEDLEPPAMEVMPTATEEEILP